MSTYHLHIAGQVQGVGFRPFVYQAAQLHGLNGWVNNTVNGVHIEFNASRDQARKFKQYVVGYAPLLSRITDSTLQKVAHQEFKQFEILRSNNQGRPKLMLTPDFALCRNCRAEFHDPGNVRFQYPFISCTHCGPRFSIMKDLPYDRDQTTMAEFSLCPHCQSEYDDPQDRRYYAQTNSCPSCAIELTLAHSGGKILPLKQHEIIELSVVALKEGKIIAVKGIGGFLLLCDATNAEAVRRLRTKKNRPKKPFAVLYPSLDTLKGDVDLSTLQEQSLTGPVGPIQLTKLKETPLSGIVTEAVAPGLSHLGVMLPYAPILENLAGAVHKPLVATSGNLSGSPIVFQNEQALAGLDKFAELVLLHSRDIVVPQDDSVVKIASKSQTPVLLRRSRGIAPGYWGNGSLPWGSNLLALGAQLKGTFTLTQQNQVYVSQYLGNLESYDAQESYKTTLKHFFRLFDFHPEKVIIDHHPQYFSNIYGHELAGSPEVELCAVQHHEAHFAAVLAENALIDTGEEVLGVIWDGTGLGTDGQIWGGEFFLYRDFEFHRHCHLSYFPVLSGDKMAREPRLSAFALAGKDYATLEDKFMTKEFEYYQKLLHHRTLLNTSSMGRLFDAVSCLLGLTDFNAYEGEAALLLEDLATRYFTKHGTNGLAAYQISLEENTIDCHAVCQAIIGDLGAGESRGAIAARFHLTLVTMVKEIAVQAGTEKIAFSGGTFQNTLLIDLLIGLLGEEFQLFFHGQLSPNDENISFGQVAHFLIREQKSLPVVKRKVTYA